MLNKAMLFSSKGVMFKEVSSNELNVTQGKNLSLGEAGQIKCNNYVFFIKHPDSSVIDKTTFKHIEVYVFDTLIFKGHGAYHDGGGHSMPSITADFEGEIFKVKIEGQLYKEVSVLVNCE